MLNRCKNCGLLYRDKCCGLSRDYILQDRDMVRYSFFQTRPGAEIEEATHAAGLLYNLTGNTITEAEGHYKAYKLVILEVNDEPVAPLP
jgi:hypothetical protein